jgi:ABC-type Fe3+ transport system substrate-binding protein
MQNHEFHVVTDRRTLLKGLAAAAGLAAFAPALAACGSSGSSGSAAPTAGASWQDGGGTRWTDALKAGQAEGNVVVAGNPSLGTPLSKVFKDDTGINLTFLGGDPGTLAARVEREATAGKASMDIWFGGSTAYSADYLVPFGDQLILPTVTDGSHWLDGQLAWMDPDTKKNLETSAQVTGWLTVNTDEVKSGSLQTWDDLLKPEFKGKIAAYDPTGPGPGQQKASQIVAEKGIDYFTELFVGQGVKLLSSSGNQLMEGLARQNYNVVIGATASDVARYQGDFDFIDTVLPSDVPPWVSSGYGVVKQVSGSPHPHAAIVFLNWFASERGQSVYQPITLETSRRLDVTKKGILSVTVPKNDVKYVDAYSVDVLKQRSSLVAQLTNALGGK